MSAALAVTGYAPTILSAVKQAWPTRNRAKMVAREIGASPRTIQDWLQERRTPNAEQLLALMAASPEIESAVARFVAERRAARGRAKSANERRLDKDAVLAGDGGNAGWDGRDRRKAGGRWTAPTVTRRCEEMTA